MLKLDHKTQIMYNATYIVIQYIQKAQETEKNQKKI